MFLTCAPLQSCYVTSLRVTCDRSGLSTRILDRWFALFSGGYPLKAKRPLTATNSFEGVALEAPKQEEHKKKVGENTNEGNNGGLVQMRQPQGIPVPRDTTGITLTESHLP